MSVVLVAGSYPPTPGPASAAALTAVKRAFAEGEDVVVISPRPSAAVHHGTLTGPRGVLTLLRLGRSVGADSLVFCLERGVPFHAGSAPCRTRLEAALFRAATIRFKRVTLTLSDDLGVAPAALRALWAGADEVVVADTAASTWANRTWGVPASITVVRADDPPPTCEIIIPEASIANGLGVTPWGPPELGPDSGQSRLARRIDHQVSVLERRVGTATRRVMGDRTSAVSRLIRPPLGRLRAKLRSGPGAT